MRPTILVVEDEPDAAANIRDVLTAAGYDVPETAPSCERALDATARLAPALVLMDVHLSGGVDGVETARRMRALRPIPIVYLTGDDEEATLARAKETEPVGYLKKPFSARELRMVVEIALHQHALSHALAVAERLAAVATMAAGMQHEINNPLAVVIANVRIALDLAKAAGHDGIAEPLEDARDGAERIRRTLAELRAVIGDGEQKLDDPAIAAVLRPTRRARVLVVDDEIGIGRAMRRMLEPEHDVVLETDATAARELLARERFDVVFCDLMMPAMSGMELFEAVAPDVAARFVFLTGGAFSPRSEEFLRTTKNRCLAKPFAREDVLRILDSLPA